MRGKISYEGLTEAIDDLIDAVIPYVVVFQRNVVYCDLLDSNPDEIANRLRAGSNEP